MAKKSGGNRQVLSVGVSAPLINAVPRAAMPALGICYSADIEADRVRVFRAIVPLDDMIAANDDPDKMNRLGNLVIQLGVPVGLGEASHYIPDLNQDKFES